MTRRRGRRLALGLCALAGGGCFGLASEPARHYYVLTCERPPGGMKPLFPGLVRVRDLDAESAYDRFQMVLRKSPFELTYRQRDVWAVKPSRMLSDIMARSLVAENLFSGVTRELGERRPQYLMSGELHAIEVIEDGQGDWTVHLALSLSLTHFASGSTLWTSHFDAAHEAPRRNYAGAVEALSNLAAEAFSRATVTLKQVPLPSPVPPASASGR